MKKKMLVQKDLVQKDKIPIEIEENIWTMDFPNILCEEFRKEYSFSEAQNINSWEKLISLAFHNKNVRNWLMELRFRWKAPFEISREMPEYEKMLGTTPEEWENVKCTLKNYESSMQEYLDECREILFALCKDIEKRAEELEKKKAQMEPLVQILCVSESDLPLPEQCRIASWKTEETKSNERKRKKLVAKERKKLLGEYLKGKGIDPAILEKTRIL